MSLREALRLPSTRLAAQGLLAEPRSAVATVVDIVAAEADTRTPDQRVVPAKLRAPRSRLERFSSSL